MLQYNTMRFGTDTFTVTEGDDPVIGGRQALLVSNESLDATNATAVTSITITGNEPTGTSRRFMFKIDGKVYRFVNGTLTEYTGAINVSNVLANGNTAAELTTLSNITGFAGKQIYPIIALESQGNNEPTAKIAINVSSSVESKERVSVKQWQVLPAPSGVIPKITEVTASTACTGNGTATVEVRFKDATGTISSYMPLTDAAGQEAVEVAFRITYRVSTVGSDTAKVNSVTVKYIAEGDVVTGETSDFYSVIPDFETNLRLCYLVIRHKKLINSTIEAFANFFPKPKHRERIYIGFGRNETRTYTLGSNGAPDAQINPSTLRIYVDGNATTNFDFNTETCELTISAPDGKSILASYDYDCGSEVWHPMIREFNQQPYFDGSYMTRFSYVLPDDYDASRANIRVRLTRPQGRVSNEFLGTAQGRTQQFVLPHFADASTIRLNADFSYDAETRVLTCVATKGTDLRISYNYVGEQHTIYSWAAGWAAA